MMARRVLFLYRGRVAGLLPALAAALKQVK